MDENNKAMSFIQHKPGKIPHPEQFLQRKLSGFNKRQKYLRSIRLNTLEYDEDLEDAIKIAQDEYNERYPEINDQLQEAEDHTALNEKIGALLDNLDEFEEYLSTKITETAFNESSDKDLDETIKDLNKKYKDKVNID
jgi:hypothetical protein